MNLKAIRNIHLYLGVFFAPLLMFFLITGCWQTFELNHSSDQPGGYQSPVLIRSLSEVHTDQRWIDGHLKPDSSIPFRTLILLMSLGLLDTTILGIIMAFKYTRPWGLGLYICGSLHPGLSVMDGPGVSIVCL
jgi:hypothetical protein